MTDFSCSLQGVELDSLAMPSDISNGPMKLKFLKNIFAVDYSTKVFTSKFLKIKNWTIFHISVHLAWSKIKKSVYNRYLFVAYFMTPFTLLFIPLSKIMVHLGWNTKTNHIWSLRSHESTKILENEVYFIRFLGSLRPNQANVLWLCFDSGQSADKLTHASVLLAEAFVMISTHSWVRDCHSVQNGCETIC